MVAIGHTAVGASIGLLTYQYITQDPFIGITIASTTSLASHYFFDLLPHGHFSKYKDFKKYLPLILVFDLFLGILIFSGIALLKFSFSLPTYFIIFAILTSQLPDVLGGFVHAKLFTPKGLLKKEFDFHVNTHWHGKFGESLLISKTDLWQLAVVLISFFYIFSY